MKKTIKIVVSAVMVAALLWTLGSWIEVVGKNWGAENPTYNKYNVFVMMTGGKHD